MALTIGAPPGGAMLKLTGISGAMVVLAEGASGMVTIGGVALTKADGVTPLIGNLAFTPINFPLNFNLTGLALNLNFAAVNLTLGEFPYIDLSVPSLPDIHLPSIDLTVPGLDLGRFGFPAVNFPSINLPSFNLPALNLPSFNLSVDFTLPNFQNFLSLAGLLDFDLGSFIRLRANFKFARLGDEIVVVADTVGASLDLGSFHLGLTNGTLGLLINTAATVAVEAQGALTLTGAGLANVSAPSVRVQYNTTGIDY